MKKNLTKCFCIVIILLFSSSLLAQNNKSPRDAYSLGSGENLIKNLKDQINPSNYRTLVQRVELKVSSSKSFLAKINFTELEDDHEVFIGEIKNVPSSSFSIRRNGKRVEGNILLKNSNQAYSYYSDLQGNTYVKEADINDIICINFEKQPVPSTTKKTTNASIGVAALSLESYPGANGCVYIDFDGQYVSGTQWGNPIDALPSGLSDAQIQEVWEIVSEDFRPFHLNITTNEAVFNTYAKNRRMRCIVTPTTTASPGSGGVAFIGSFSWNDDSPCWVFNLGTKAAGETVSHEVGHTLGLRHDGRINPSETYYGGQGNWAPIMGVSFDRNITQWSKGEYISANNTEDDLAIISSSTNGLNYKTDDYGNSFTSAAILPKDAAGNVNVAGLIEKTSDIDLFSFTAGGGNVILNFNTASRHSDLDILATLYNSAGGIIATSNPTGLAAGFNINLAAGNYYVSVDGTGFGDPASTGYSDYASLGYYSISGKIPAGTLNAVATVFQDCNYGGYSVNLEPGNYTLAQLNAKGILNNDVSSFTLSAGYEILLFQYDNFSQSEWYIFTGSISCLQNVLINGVPRSVNDLTTSIIVRAQGNLNPSVSISSPVNGMSYSQVGSIIINATATSPNGYITKVEFFNGSAKLGEDVSEPYSFVWNSNIPSGTYNLTAKATDNIGAQSVSSVVNITVTNSQFKAIIYQDCNYNSSTGYAVGLSTGGFLLSDLNALGIYDNDLSSFKLTNGYEILLYQDDNFQGGYYIFRGDVPCLTSVLINNIPMNINDIISSILVRPIASLASSSISSESATGNSSGIRPIVLTPNPVVDRLGIQFDNKIFETANLCVFNMYNREVMSQQNLVSGDQVDLSKLNSGIYYVRVVLGETIINRRIIKY